MIFEPELETMPREELGALQLERLRSLVAYVKERVPLYRERLEDIEPQDIGSLDDLRRLPVTRKDDLRDTYPLGMLATPPRELARIHASSGTTGKPTVVAYTTGDLDLFARDGRRGAGDDAPQRLRLRALHGRARPPRRRRAPRHDGGPSVRRDDGTPADPHRGSSTGRDRMHPELRADAGARVQRARDRARRDQPPLRARRSGAVDSSSPR